jgi:hypothetical protein
MPVGQNAARIDVNDGSYKSVVISVGTSQVEAKCDTTRDPNRQFLVIYNDSNATVYYGPTGVTTSGATKGFPLFKQQWVSIPMGDVGVFLIAASSSNSVLVQEFA